MGVISNGSLSPGSFPLFLVSFRFPVLLLLACLYARSFLMARLFSTCIGVRRPFVVRYQIGGKVKVWETSDYTPAMVRSRFFKQAFSKNLIPTVRIVGIYEVLEVINVG